jgi:hypothetical protein
MSEPRGAGKTGRVVRPRLGHGELALDPSKSVFINCPFDADYASTFEAILFASVCCGFMPRSALESGTVAEPRMARITRAIFASKYSIHDLSRCTGEGSENLARFNMPLELGIAMARRFAKPKPQHDWLVLVPSGHAYVRFISDLAGYDPPRYDGTIERATIAVIGWLATRDEVIPPITPAKVLGALPRFQNRTTALAADWRQGPPWPDVVQAAIDVAKTIA